MVSLDMLFQIAEASPALDKVEASLREGGHTRIADDLLKLQQDTGVAIDREMCGYDPAEPAPGPETAKLNAAYEPVTVSRLQDTFQSTVAAIPDSAVKNDFVGFIAALKLPVPVSPAPQAPSFKK
jgi:hypothetical protein